MVKPWTIAIDKGIKITKYRIAHHEKHGNGEPAMQDKFILKKQERHKRLRDDLLK